MIRRIKLMLQNGTGPAGTNLTISARLRPGAAALVLALSAGLVGCADGGGSAGPAAGSLDRSTTSDSPGPGGPGSSVPAEIDIRGTVAAVDTANRTFTLRNTESPYSTVLTTSATKFRFSEGEDAALSDLEPELLVAVAGGRDGPGRLSARLVTILS